MKYTRNQLTQAINELIADLEARESLLRNLLSRVEPSEIYVVYDEEGKVELSRQYSEWQLDRFMEGNNKYDYVVRKEDNGNEEVEARDACTWELLKKLIK